MIHTALLMLMISHLFGGKKMATIERNLQTWAETNGFKFCISTTVCMHFEGQHIVMISHCHVSPIPVVEQSKSDKDGLL